LERWCHTTEALSALPAGMFGPILTRRAQATGISVPSAGSLSVGHGRPDRWSAICSVAALSFSKFSFFLDESGNGQL
jgi:hypothetical protein